MTVNLVLRFAFMSIGSLMVGFNLRGNLSNVSLGALGIGLVAFGASFPFS